MSKSRNHLDKCWYEWNKETWWTCMYSLRLKMQRRAHLKHSLILSNKNVWIVYAAYTQVSLHSKLKHLYCVRLIFNPAPENSVPLPTLTFCPYTNLHKFFQSRFSMTQCHRLLFSILINTWRFWPHPVAFVAAGKRKMLSWEYPTLCL